MRCEECGKRFTPRRASAITCSNRCRIARHRRLHASTPPWPEGTYDLVMVDFPLRWVGYSAKGEGRSPQRHYPTMDVRPLIRLLRPMFDALAAKNCVVCWWVY